MDIWRILCKCYTVKKMRTPQYHGKVLFSQRGLIW